MRYLLLILLLVFGNAQDEYPNFSDPKLQLEFEELRIYVEEKSGEETIVTGGGSSTQMANPLSVLLLGETPQYVAVADPIETTVKYWYEFTIEQNNKNLTEVEFLNKVGLKDKAKTIITDFNQKLDAYKIHIQKYNSETENSVFVNRGWIDNLMTPKVRWRTKRPKENVHVLTYTLFGLGLAYAGVSYNYKYNANKHLTMYHDGLIIYNDYYIYEEGYQVLRNFSIILSVTALTNMFKKKRKVVMKAWKYPESRIIYPKKPRLEQTLSSKQIIALADSYNRKIYKEIKEKNE